MTKWTASERIILSAGQGKRLLPLTERAPKCMLPVLGRPLIGGRSTPFSGAASRDINVVVGFGAELVERGSRSLRARRIRTLYNPFYAIQRQPRERWVARADMEKEFPDSQRRHAVRGFGLEAPSGARRSIRSRSPSAAKSIRRRHMKVIRDGDRLLQVWKKLARDEVNADRSG